MTLKAGLQTLSHCRTWSHPAPTLPTAVQKQYCSPRDLPSDLVGALPRTRWEPYPSTHLVTGPPFANSTEDLEVDHCCRYQLRPWRQSHLPRDQTGSMPTLALGKGLPTTDATVGPPAATWPDSSLTQLWSQRPDRRRSLPAKISL